MGTHGFANSPNKPPRDPLLNQGDPGRLQDREDGDPWRKPHDAGVSEKRSLTSD